VVGAVFCTVTVGHVPLSQADENTDFYTATMLQPVDIVLIVEYVRAEEQRALEEWLAAQLEVIGEYVQAMEREQARAAAAVRRAPQPRSAPSGSSGATGQCGGATNGADRFIARESGGNPGVYNTGGSGAWGCYQIMPGTWAGSCSDLGSYGSASASVQAQCASRLPLAAWRASGPTG
jgi:hypothetical protein